MNIQEYLQWVDDNGLSTEDQKRVMAELQRRDQGLDEVDQEDLDRLAEDIGVLQRVLRSIWGFFKKIF